jgi:hypothetical protein
MNGLIVLVKGVRSPLSQKKVGPAIGGGAFYYAELRLQIRLLFFRFDPFIEISIGWGLHEVLLDKVHLASISCAAYA